ncbi:hypothetical protein FO519_006655, partial [Halicephalobus sp. NKZ332]
YLKPQFAGFWRIRSFRRKAKYGMHRNKEDVVCIKTKLGGKVYYDISTKVPRIERPHPDQLEGEPRCSCCPPPMSGHRMLIIGEFAYVYGGLCPVLGQDPQLSTDVWRLNLLDNTWKNIPLEQEAHNVTPVSYSWIATRKWGILTFGGTGYPFSNFNGDRLCQLNFVTNSDGEQRFRLSCFEYSGDKPPGCYGVVLVPDEENDCVYLMGGTNGHEYYYDVHKGRIQETPNGNFHVTWERISITYFDLKEEFYGVIETTPDPVHGSPRERDCFAISKYENSIFVMGGRGTPDGSLLYNDIWSLNLKSMQWKKKEMGLSFKTSFHASAIDEEGRIYVFGGHRGGIRDHTVVRTNMVQSFLAAPPSLKTVCQRFIAQTYKKGMKLSDEATQSNVKFVKEVLPYYTGSREMSRRTSSRVSSASSCSYT